MRMLSSTSPIPYRKQNAGDYHIPTMELKTGLEQVGLSGFALHSKSTGA